MARRVLTLIRGAARETRRDVCACLATSFFLTYHPKGAYTYISRQNSTTRHERKYQRGRQDKWEKERRKNTNTGQGRKEERKTVTPPTDLSGKHGHFSFFVTLLECFSLVLFFHSVSMSSIPFLHHSQSYYIPTPKTTQQQISFILPSSSTHHQRRQARMQRRKSRALRHCRQLTMLHHPL